jgi:hypothetical protein
VLQLVPQPIVDDTALVTLCDDITETGGWLEFKFEALFTDLAKLRACDGVFDTKYHRHQKLQNLVLNPLSLKLLSLQVVILIVLKKWIVLVVRI